MERTRTEYDGVGSSITDELRVWLDDNSHLGSLPDLSKQLLRSIADRIDAEHERQLEVLYRDMSDAEYVKLHKDTGGEYIREHDKVDWRDHAGTWHENATVVAVCNDGCYVMDGAVFHVHKSDIRHYHEPTVDDLLFSYGQACIRASNEAETDAAKQTMLANLRHEYAEKLRLAEGAE